MLYALRKLIAFMFLGGMFWFIYQDLGNLDKPWFMHALGLITISFAFFWLLIPMAVVKLRIRRRLKQNRERYEKWLADVTEFKWYEGIEVHKVYLSAILDLYDRRFVAYVVGDRNDNPLVFKTFDRAVKANPDAHPLFHSDRGFQYTNRTFHHKLEKAFMTQSMSRVAKCIDNGPMEGFWGILKRERYYGKRFTSKKELVDMIENYIRYYNHYRVQRSLGILTPLEKHNLYLAA